MDANTFLIQVLNGIQGRLRNDLKSALDGIAASKISLLDQSRLKVAGVALEVGCVQPRDVLEQETEVAKRVHGNGSPGGAGADRIT